MRWQMTLADMLPPAPTDLWTLARQAGGHRCSDIAAGFAK